MRESKIEEKGGDHAKERGLLHLKFSSPGRAAVPDRIVLAQVPEFLRPIIAKYFRFIEYKATGEEATVPQAREHKRLRELGFAVDVVDNVEDAKRIIDAMGDV